MHVDTMGHAWKMVEYVAHVRNEAAPLTGIVEAKPTCTTGTNCDGGSVYDTQGKGPGDEDYNGPALVQTGKTLLSAACSGERRCFEESM